MQAMHDQQAEERARLHASQSSTPQASFTATIQDQGHDRPGAAGQASTAQQPCSHRAQETPGGGDSFPKIASIIRSAQHNRHVGFSVSSCRCETAFLNNAEDTVGSPVWARTLLKTAKRTYFCMLHAVVNLCKTHD